MSRSTVRDFENSRYELHRRSEVLIRIAPVAAGVGLVEAEGAYGPGVRLVSSPIDLDRKEVVASQDAARCPVAVATSGESKVENVGL